MLPRFLVAWTIVLAGCRSTRPETTSLNTDGAPSATVATVKLEEAWDGSHAKPIADAPASKRASLNVPTVAPTSRVTARDATRLAFIDAQHLAWAADEPLDVTVVDLVAKRVTLHLKPGPRGIVDDEGVTAIAASPTAIVTATAGNVRTWDSKAGKLVRELLPKDDHRVVKALACLADGSIVASIVPHRAADIGKSTIEIRRWAPDGTPMFTLLMPTAERWENGSAGDFALSPDGSRIATGMDEVVVLDAHTGVVVGTPFGHVNDGKSVPTLKAVRWLDSGVVAYMAAYVIGDVEAHIHIVHATGSQMTFSAHLGGLEAAAALADGRVVTAGHEDRHVTVRDTSGTPVCELGGVPGNTWSLAVSRDDKSIAVATDKEITVWELAGCDTETPAPKR